MKNKTILVVDDVASNLDILVEHLDDYEIIDTIDGYEAIEIAYEEHIDLILLDIVMPNIDGFEVCRKLKADPATSDIPIIFLTANSDEKSVERAYEVGGIDYVTKPFRKKELLSRINTHIKLSEYTHNLENIVERKTRELQEANDELEKIQEELIFALGVVGESRCGSTAAHVKRVAYYSKLLAELYGLDDKDVKIVFQTTPMHDIGKVGIPDNILNKPGKLTKEEFDIMKTHTVLGYEVFKNTKRELLKAASVIAYQHHEKWDGSGYPQGLSKEDIHIYARITAVADVFDALGEARIYKDKIPDEKIIKIFEEGRGTHFEPKLVDLFLDNFDKFVEIRERIK